MKKRRKRIKREKREKLRSNNLYRTIPGVFNIDISNRFFKKENYPEKESDPSRTDTDCTSFQKSWMGRLQFSDKRSHLKSVFHTDTSHF